MLDLALFGFLGAFLALGMRRPFVWVLAYIYVDIVAPQKISWGLLASVPVSLLVFLACFGGWLVLDKKKGAAFTFRQFLILLLLIYAGLSTFAADFQEEAWAKWDWVWKALLFAMFLPLTLRTRFRIEAAALVMVLSLAAIIINAGIKTVLSGGGYGMLQSYVNDNTGLYEGSTLSMVAMAVVPLIVWLMKHGTVFPPDWRVKLFGVCLIFACLMVPIGTQTRTGLLCMGVVAVLALRDVKRRFLIMGLMGAIGVMAIPFLPQSYLARMNTIQNHEGDESASTRIAVWKWTLDYVKEKPLGGGFDAFLGNSFTYRTRKVDNSGGMESVEYVTVTDKGRAFHSAYFELLGELGWPGLGLWLLIQVTGLVQLEFVRRRLRRSRDRTDQSLASLANALQVGHIVYLVGAGFVGIAYQPFVFMLVALQIALVQQAKKRAGPVTLPLAQRPKPGLKPLAAPVTAPVAAAEPGAA